MRRSRAGRAPVIVAAAVAVVVWASTANAVVPISQGVPKDPGPVPAELLPTPAQTAAHALSDWITNNPNTSTAGGVGVLPDRQSVVVYWKGPAPAELQKLAEGQPVPVVFREAIYSRAELGAAAKALAKGNPGIVAAAGVSGDFSGITVMLTSKAPATALSELRATSSAPIVSARTGDTVPLNDPIDGASQSQ